MYKTFTVLMLSMFLLQACTQNKSTLENTEPNSGQTMKLEVKDIHSFAQPHEARIVHLDWEAKVDFEHQRIRGVARWQIEALANAQKLVLDTKALEIDRVTIGTNEEETSYSLSPAQPHLGRGLHIDIKENTEWVTVYYSTTAGAEALQWLSVEQTAGKEQPFLFTQSQAILARSWLPVQDSPGIRFSYSAKVEVPRELMALMSAENPQEKTKDGVYSFTMAQPIPAYLFALTVGDIEFAAIGPRTGVYAEPSTLAKATYEFGALEAMVKTAEELYGPYRWERYDIVVLPPSFPFGGMENPRLTFATPTILAGDRSLTSLVAHELAHSWSGNLVTNATWNDFWLNEGFTVYFEQRIMEALYGRDYAEMLAALAVTDLKEEITSMIADGQGQDTRLKLDLEGRNPDDGVTAIAYDKGYLFLRMLEEKVGREIFDAFVKTYFEDNAFQVMTTEAFIDYMKEHLLEKNSVDMEPMVYKKWIYGKGLPDNAPRPKSDRFAKVDAILSAWLETGQLPNTVKTQWSSHELQHFIRSLPEDISLGQLAVLDETFGLSHTGNSEIFAAWMVPVIRQDYEKAYPQLEAFLIRTGRRKFLMPIYSELIKGEEGRKRALDIYAKARPNYHFVSTHSLDKLLGHDIKN